MNAHRNLLESQNAIKRLSPSALRKFRTAQDELRRLKEQYEVPAKLRVNPRLARVRGRYHRDIDVVEISTWMLESISEDEVIATIRHEYAHALTPAYLPSHGSTWRQWADELGVPRERDASPAPKWVARCTEHGDLGGWQRQPTCLRSCRACGRRITYVKVG